MKSFFAVFLCCVLGSASVIAGDVEKTDGEVWNEGITYYQSGDFTNALRVLKPLLLSKSHGSRAAEVVAKIHYDRGETEEASNAAQIALRANPSDDRVNRNFTRATDGLLQYRENKRIDGVLRAAQGKDPGAIMLASTRSVRQLMDAAGTYRTNSPARAISLADSLSHKARELSDAWIVLRETIAQSVTNQDQASTIIAQIESAQAKTKRAAEELSDMDGNAYGTISDVEHDFTRFLKLTALPPTAISEDLVAQSNAWQDVDAINGRGWQQEALDYTRVFRAKFPAWARAYEQQAQADTNKPPFTAEDQAKVSALATELEKVQIECCEKSLPPSQERALSLMTEINELLPKDKNNQGGGQDNQPQADQNNNQQQNQDKQDKQDQESKADQQQNSDQQQNQQQDQQSEEKKDEESTDDKKEEEQSADEQEIEAMLKKAQERNDEHEADKKARMRKSALPPNERDW